MSELSQAGREARDKVLADGHAWTYISELSGYVEILAYRNEYGGSYHTGILSTAMSEDAAWIDAASRLPAKSTVPCGGCADDRANPSGADGHTHGMGTIEHPEPAQSAEEKAKPNRPKLSERMSGPSHPFAMMAHVRACENYMDALEAENAALKAKVSDLDLMASHIGQTTKLVARAESAEAALATLRAQLETKPQPSGLPYTMEECVERVNQQIYLLGRAYEDKIAKVLRDAVTSWRGMAK